MRCRQVEAQLAEYVDRVLDARRRERIEAHLRGCAACRAAAEDARAAVDVLGALSSVRAPASFAPRIRSAVRVQAQRALAPPLLGRDVRTALGGVCVMVVFGVLATQYLGRPRSYVAPTPAGAVAVARVTLAPPMPQARVSGPHATSPRAVRPSAAAPRVSRVRLGTDRSLSAVMGVAPSRARLTPKPAEMRRPPVPKPTLAAAPSVVMAALTDSSTGPRLTEGSSEMERRLVTVPVTEPAPSAGSPGAVMVADVGGSSGGLEAGLPSAAGEAEAAFGLDDLFDESSVPRYADVS